MYNNVYSIYERSLVATVQCTYMVHTVLLGGDFTNSHLSPSILRYVTNNRRKYYFDVNGWCLYFLDV